MWAQHWLVLCLLGVADGAQAHEASCQGPECSETPSQLSSILLQTRRVAQQLGPARVKAVVEDLQEERNSAGDRIEGEGQSEGTGKEVLRTDVAEVPSWYDPSGCRNISGTYHSYHGDVRLLQNGCSGSCPGHWQFSVSGNTATIHHYGVVGSISGNVDSRIRIAWSNGITYTMTSASQGQAKGWIQEEIRKQKAATPSPMAVAKAAIAASVEKSLGFSPEDAAAFADGWAKMHADMFADQEATLAELLPKVCKITSKLFPAISCDKDWAKEAAKHTERFSIPGLQ